MIRSKGLVQTRRVLAPRREPSMWWAPASSGSTRSGAVALLPPGTPLHWFDLTDPTTRFEDEAGTTPAVADNATVMRVNDKGSGAEFLTVTTGGPVVELAGAPMPTGPTSAIYFDGAEILTGAMEAAVTSFEHCSMCTVFAAEVQDSFDYIFTWPDIFTGIGSRVDSLGDASMWMNSQGFQSDTEFPVDTWMSQIMVSNDEAGATELFKMWHSHTEDVEASSQHNTGTTEVDDVFTLGGLPASAKSTSWIGEVIVYDGILTAAEVALMQVYVTAKYGIAWT